MSLVFRFSGITTLDGDKAIPTPLPADVQLVRQAQGNYMVQRAGGVTILAIGRINLNILVNLAAGRNADDVLVTQVAARDNNVAQAAVLVNVGVDVGNAQLDPLLDTFRPLGPQGTVDLFTNALPVFTSQELLVGGTIGLGPWGLSIVCLAWVPKPCCMDSTFAATGGPP